MDNIRRLADKIISDFNLTVRDRTDELLKLDLTVILITHNQELIKKCDRIIKIL